MWQGNTLNIPTDSQVVQNGNPDDAQVPGILSLDGFVAYKRGQYFDDLQLAAVGAAELIRLQEDMIEELAEINWGLAIRYPSTASFEAVESQVPYYILKHVAARRTNPISERCARVILRLMMLGSIFSQPLDSDDVGTFYRKGIKRTLDERVEAEPGCGGNYHHVYDESSDDSESDSDTEYEEFDTSVDMEDDSQVDQLGRDFSRLHVSERHLNPFMSCRSQLNGSHGEWTESDDVNKGKRGSNTGSKRSASTIPARRNTKSKTRQKGKKIAAREVGVALASTFVGPDMARMGYKLASKGIRLTKGIGNKVLVLSSQASKYLMAYVKPFDNSVQQVSIPRPPATRSFKVTGYIRGAGAIGQNGVGFVAVAPTLCNDRPSVFYTTSAYTQTVLGAPISDFGYGTPTYQNGGTLWPASSVMANLPYNSASLLASSGGVGSVNEVAGRIVSCSVRLYYTGTTLNESGSYYCYSDPDVNNVLGGNHSSAAPPTGYSISGLLSKDATEIIKIKGKSEANLVRISADPNMDDYPRANNNNLRKLYPYSAGEFYTNSTDNDVGAASMVIAIDGVKEQPFYFEVVTHVEYIGSGVTQGLLSDTNNDAVGYDCVKNLLQHAQREVASNPNRTFKQAMQAEMKRQGVRMGTGQRSVDY